VHASLISITYGFILNFGGGFHLIARMDDTVEVARLTIEGYAPRDPAFAAVYQRFRAIAAAKKGAHATWTPGSFASAISELSQLVYQEPGSCVSRTLLVGVIIHDDLMLVIPESLQHMLRLCERSVRDHLFQIGWIPEPITDILWQRLYALFGRDFFMTAQQQQLRIEVRVARPPSVSTPAPELSDSLGHDVVAESVLLARTDNLEQAQAQMAAMPEQISSLSSKLEEARRQIEDLINQHSQFDAEREALVAELIARDDRILALDNDVRQARREIDALIEEHSNSDIGRGRLIDDLLTRNHQLESDIALSEERVRTLMLEFREKDRPRTVGWRFPVLREPCYGPEIWGPEDKMPSVHSQQDEILYMFYNWYDICQICSATELPALEIFRVLQALILPPSCKLPAEVEFPVQWGVDPSTLRRIVQRFPFAFSGRVAEQFPRTNTIPGVFVMLTQALQDYSQRPERDWRPMVLFILEMAVHGALQLQYHPPAVVDPDLVRQKEIRSLKKDLVQLNLLDEIDKLRSTKGKLLHNIRVMHERFDDYVAQNRVDRSGLFCKIRMLEELGGGTIDMDALVASESQVRADVFRELVQLALHAQPPHYSDRLYDLAVVLMFRSRSSYEFLRLFLPLPATSSIYYHFRDALKDSADRLKSLDQVGAYLDSRIERYPEIASGVVLGVDAISCANTFVGMKHVAESEVAYLFVVYLQPVIPGPKCSPLFIIESKSGMADDEVQKTIDTIIAIARQRIRWVLLASDGDPSYYERHRVFLQFWEAHYKQGGLPQVLTQLNAPSYTGDLPLSDMPHLAKCFRTRFLKYELTFTHGEFRKSTSVKLMRKHLKLGAPLTDLSQVGKMRDAYPLVICRIEHIVKLFEMEANAEAVVWLPLSLCFNACRLENIVKSTRLFMLRISFFLVRKLYELKKAKKDKMPETSKTMKTTLFTSQWSVRFLDTVLLQIWAIEKFGKLAIDHFSTQSLENFFGCLRRDCNDINTPPEMENAIAHTDIVTTASYNLEVSPGIPGRASLAGVHIDDTMQDGVAYDIAMELPHTPETIAALCLKAVHAQEGSLTPDEQIAFLQFRQYLSFLKMAAENSRTNKEIDHGHASTSSTRTVHMIVSHGTPPQ
jgi:hypothetical protein